MRATLLMDDVNHVLPVRCHVTFKRCVLVSREAWCNLVQSLTSQRHRQREQDQRTSTLMRIVGSSRLSTAGSVPLRVTEQIWELAPDPTGCGGIGLRNQPDSAFDSEWSEPVVVARRKRHRRHLRVEQRGSPQNRRTAAAANSICCNTP